MTTRADLRTDLTNKMLAMEDGSYGDFEFSTTELDLFLDLSCLRMFPAVYKRDSATGLSLTGYGHHQLGYVTDSTIVYDRVFMVEDADELAPIVGWTTRGDKIVGIDTQLYSSVNVYWTAGYTLPSDDETAITIPDLFLPLLNLGALVEALESRQDTGVRGEPAPTGPFFETQLLDRLRPRYDALKAELAMSPPGIVF